MFQAEAVEKIKTPILRAIHFFPKNGAVDEIMRKHMVQPDRAQTTIWFMSITCWITKDTDTHSEYVILTAFLQNQWLHDGAAVFGLYVLSSFIFL
jgi:hypothetical protein